jgi:predicted phage tail protein
MIENSEFRKRFFVKLLSDPKFLIPFVIGSTFLSSVLALGISKIGILVGLGGILVSFGILSTKFLLYGEKYGQEILDEIENYKKTIKENNINKLISDLENISTSKMKLDNMLEDLKSICDDFEKEFVDCVSPIFLEVKKNINNIFEKCIDGFKDIIKISNDIQSMKSNKLKIPLIEKRNQTIIEMEESILNVEEAIIEFRKINSGKSNSNESLYNLSSELKRTLEVAKRVEERKNSEFSGIDIKEYQ